MAVSRFKLMVRIVKLRKNWWVFLVWYILLMAMIGTLYVTMSGNYSCIGNSFVEKELDTKVKSISLFGKKFYPSKELGKVDSLRLDVVEADGYGSGNPISLSGLERLSSLRYLEVVDSANSAKMQGLKGSSRGNLGVLSVKYEDGLSNLPKVFGVSFKKSVDGLVIIFDSVCPVGVMDFSGVSRVSFVDCNLLDGDVKSSLRVFPSEVKGVNGTTGFVDYVSYSKGVESQTE